MSDRKIDASDFRLAVGRLRELQRSFAALGDGMREAQHKLVTEYGWQWRFPDAVLSEEQLEALESRRFARTLAAIDDLPETSGP